uniref:Putative radical SAM superfamily protein n=1 Tax=viral metagenome TaxID=1070528 RepID=A0A6H1Z9S0_9ZZZZ
MKPDITLIFPDSPFLITKNMFPPLGIMYLSAFLKQKGLEVQCLDVGGLGHTIDMVEADTVGISITTPQRDSAFEIARHLKEQGKTLIAGGPHASHMASECYDDGFDCVINGYGEACLYRLFNFEQSGINPPIDELPYPDRDCLPIKEYEQYIDGRPATVLMASRGCPYNCSFCANIKAKFEMQSAERTLAELFYVQEKYGYTAFTLYDDTFAISKKRLKIMADALENKDFRFRCFCRSDLLSDDICGDFARMGMDTIGIGIESGSDVILKRNMKGLSVAESTRAIKNLRKHGILSKAFLIVGLPGETHETVQETMAWIENAKPDDIAVSIFQPLPGSDVFNNPDKYGVEFIYDGQPLWYRGKPGKYVANVATEGLSPEEIVRYRDILETTYKPKELLK